MLTQGAVQMSPQATHKFLPPPWYFAQLGLVTNEEAWQLNRPLQDLLSPTQLPAAVVGAGQSNLGTLKDGLGD